MKPTNFDAVALCIKLSDVIPAAVCYVALTGGCLFKPGSRKDIDLIFYRNRQSLIDFELLEAILIEQGLHLSDNPTPAKWLIKATWEGFSVDLLCPEAETDGDY